MYFVAMKNEEYDVTFQAGAEIRKRALQMANGRYEGITASKVSSGQNSTQLN